MANSHTIHTAPPSSPWKALIAAIAAFTFIGASETAAAEPYNPDTLPSGEAAEVNQICQSVIQVRPGQSQFAACVESLSDASRGFDHTRAAVWARQSCLDKGLQPKTPELAECTLGAVDAAPPPAVRTAGVSGEPLSRKSYVMASRGEVHRREELSCAQLGLNPTSDGFARCVASLQASLFAADNPQN